MLNLIKKIDFIDQELLDEISDNDIEDLDDEKKDLDDEKEIESEASDNEDEYDGEITEEILANMKVSWVIKLMFY